MRKEHRIVLQSTLQIWRLDRAYKVQHEATLGAHKIFSASTHAPSTSFPL